MPPPPQPVGALVASVTPMTSPVEPLGGHVASAAPMTALAKALGCHVVPMAKALVAHAKPMTGIALGKESGPWLVATMRTCEVLSAP